MYYKIYSLQIFHPWKVDLCFVHRKSSDAANWSRKSFTVPRLSTTASTVQVDHVCVGDTPELVTSTTYGPTYTHKIMHFNKTLISFIIYCVVWGTKFNVPRVITIDGINVQVLQNWCYLLLQLNYWNSLLMIVYFACSYGRYWPPRRVYTYNNIGKKRVLLNNKCDPRQFYLIYIVMCPSEPYIGCPYPCHGFWVGMGAMLLFMGGHQFCASMHPTPNRSQTSRSMEYANQ